MKINIPWSYTDKRFDSGTVADIGHSFRLELRRTKKETNNKWRLYLSVRVTEENGVRNDLKRGVVVAEYKGTLSLEEAQEEARKYIERFVLDIVGNLVSK